MDLGLQLLWILLSDYCYKNVVYSGGGCDFTARQLQLILYF